MKPKTQNFLTVGDLANQTGKTVRAIHYYEELGLLAPAQRTSGGIRLFETEAVRRVETLKRLQELGFSLEQIHEMVKTWKESPNGIEAVRKLRPIIEESIRSARRKIEVFQALQNELESSLKFMHECTVCSDHPGKETCPPCRQGTHEAHLPPFISSLIT